MLVSPHNKTIQVESLPITFLPWRVEMCSPSMSIIDVMIDYYNFRVHWCQAVLAVHLILYFVCNLDNPRSGCNVVTLIDIKHPIHTSYFSTVHSSNLMKSVHFAQSEGLKVHVKYSTIIYKTYVIRKSAVKTSLWDVRSILSGPTNDAVLLTFIPSKLSV